ncbi:MAG: M20 family metallopeptidase [Eubacteriales bacterium]|nr:M20 family metallopeptidase [Eubacteriales bacterium]
MDIIKRITELSDQYEAHTLELRHQLHCHPELSFKEFETSALVQRELKRIGIPFELSPVEPGVVAEIDSGKPGKFLMLRADMDALPIQETTGLPFASENAGVMHACGHDVHTSNLLAVGEILWNTRDQWNGRVKFVFQPGEENGGGGRRMIEQGLMDELPDACFALHVMPTTPGIITVGTGAMTSYSDGFWITIHGEAAHSSTPEVGTDAIQIAAAVIQAINTISTRNIDPLDASTINIGVIRGGDAPNVIADTVELNGMMRNASPRARDTIFKRLEEVAKGTAEMMGGTAEVRFRIGYASVFNNKELAEFTADTYRKYEDALFGGITPDGKAPENWLHTGNQLMLSAEDFGFYTQKAPGCFIWVGTGGNVSNHNPNFRVEEPYIKFCTRAMAVFAAEFLQQKD